MNSRLIPQLFVAAAMLFCVNACVTQNQTALQSNSRIEIVELPSPVIPDGVKTVPWVAENDNSWKEGKPFFDIKEGTTAVANGWLGVTDTKIFLKVIVYNNDVHENNNKDGDIWSGNCLQIGIDARGDGSGKYDPQTRMLFGPDDGAFALALTKDGPQIWAYYLEKYNKGKLKDGVKKYQVRIDRNETAKTTTYEAAFPWDEFASNPARTGLFGMAVQVNDHISKSEKQNRYYWGRGADGKPGAGLFNKLAIGNPPSPFFYAGAGVTKLWSNNSYGEIVLAAACNGKISALCLANGMKLEKELGALELKNGFKKYAVRWYPGKLPETPATMEASIIDNEGKIKAQAKAEMIVPVQTINKLHARIEELKASSPNNLFTEHLRSIDAIVQSEWGRAMCMPENHAEWVANKAGDILNCLNGDAGEWNSYLQRRRELIFARTAKPDNTLQFYRLRLPLNWNSEKKYPIIVFLHGSADDPYSIYFIASISSRINIGAKPKDVIDEGQYFTMLPWGRANSAYIEAGEDDIFQALTDVSGKFKIDKDRTYLSGHSMGGFGTWATAMHNPDRWAAICIAAGGAWRIPMDIGITRNIAFLPIRIWHGEKDYSVKISYAYNMQAAMRKYGNEPVMVISPEDGHIYPDDAKVESANWLLKHSRKRPDKFSYIAFSDRWSGSWGINMKRDLKITATPSFDAVIEGNTVNIKSEGTTGLTVDCGPDGLGLNGNVTIIWNGNKAYEGPAKKVKLGDSV